MTTVAVALPWRMFAVRVARTSFLSPSVLRMTFTGDDLDQFADNGLDQRIKFFLPLPGVPYDELLEVGRSGDWFGAYRSVPPERRHPMRTYTARGVRPEVRELDVDVVLHGDLGPATRWASGATVGDELVIFGPNALADRPHGGVDFVPPAHVDRLLLAGDETALPAIAGILEQLPASTLGEVLLEMPLSEDVLVLDAPAGMSIRWLGRDGRPHGSLLVPAVQEACTRLLPSSPAQAEPEDAGDLLWEVPVDPSGAPLRSSVGLYAWLAGEAGVITTLRRHLVRDCGVDRKAVAFMGYWKAGRSEGE
jgi:NADPH-dependent ferric siderophore reductase